MNITDIAPTSPTIPQPDQDADDAILSLETNKASLVERSRQALDTMIRAGQTINNARKNLSKTLPKAAKESFQDYAYSIPAALIAIGIFYAATNGFNKFPSELTYGAIGTSVGALVSFLVEVDRQENHPTHSLHEKLKRYKLHAGIGAAVGLITSWVVHDPHFAYTTSVEAGTAIIKGVTPLLQDISKLIPQTTPEPTVSAPLAETITSTFGQLPGADTPNAMKSVDMNLQNQRTIDSIWSAIKTYSAPIGGLIGTAGIMTKIGLEIRKFTQTFPEYARQRSKEILHEMAFKLDVIAEQIYPSHNKRF